MKTIEIVGVQSDVGASKRGVSMGPAAIRYADLNKGLSLIGYKVKDKGDIQPPPQGESRPNLNNYDQVVCTNRRLFESVTDTLSKSYFPLILGGDHSIAAGSISAVSRYYKKIGVIWIDAHGDWNNEHSTLTGNMHGMPFSAACGYGPDEMAFFSNDCIPVDPRKCVLIGGRDFDPPEYRRMKEAGVTILSINWIDRYGIAEAVSQAMEIAGKDTEGIHVSYDIDALDPSSAPGTGTTVQRGLTTREAFVIAEMLHESKKILALDMVEVNPILDIRNQTGILAAELILSCLGKRIGR